LPAANYDDVVRFHSVAPIPRIEAVLEKALAPQQLA
jgi:hypothetical protein